MTSNTSFRKSLVFTLLLHLFTSVITYAGKPGKLTDKELEKRIKECKQFDIERISVTGDTIKIDYCLNAECTTYRSWRFSIMDIGEIKLVKEDDYNVIYFNCKENNCILTPPTGVTYEPKPSYTLYVKDAKEGKSLLSDLENYRKK